MEIYAGELYFLAFYALTYNRNYQLVKNDKKINILKKIIDVVYSEIE
jgi:hypothetical protein